MKYEGHEYVRQSAMSYATMYCFASGREAVSIASRIQSEKKNTQITCTSATCQSVHVTNGNHNIRILKIVTNSYIRKCKRRIT